MFQIIMILAALSRRYYEAIQFNDPEPIATTDKLRALLWSRLPGQQTTFILGVKLC